MGWTGIVLLLFTLLPLASLTASFSENVPVLEEYDVKAAFIYNFAKFMEWPPEAFASPDSALVIGILGADPFGTRLEKVTNGKRIKERALMIRRYSDREQLQASPCHILFISDSERSGLDEILKIVGGRTIVTVGDMADFSTLGGMIRLKLNDRRVSFDINTSVAQASGVKIDSQLLRLAENVRLMMDKDPG